MGERGHTDLPYFGSHASSDPVVSEHRKMDPTSST